MKMKKILLGLTVLAALAIAPTAFAQTTTTTTLPTCANGGIKCGATCGDATSPGDGTCGTHFTGMCIGVSTDTTGCQYIRCSGNTPACVSGPFVNPGQGCSSDTQCAAIQAGSVCVSDSGLAGCGDGFAQCMTACTTSTTTTT